MPSARLTSKQLEAILAKGKGYSVSTGSLPIQDSHQETMPVPECSPVDGPLAKDKSQEGGSGRFLIRIKVYRKIATDFDNQFIKWELDCLRYCGIIPDDRQQDIRLEMCEQEKVKTDGEERIEIEVFAPNSVEAQRLQKEKQR